MHVVTYTPLHARTHARSHLPTHARHKPYNSSAAAAPSVEGVDMVSLLFVFGRGGRDGVYSKKGERVSRKRMTERKYTGTRLLTHSLTHSRTHPFTDAFTHPFSRFPHPRIHDSRTHEGLTHEARTHPTTQPPIHLTTVVLTDARTLVLIHPRPPISTHAPTHLFTHPLTHPPTHARHKPHNSLSLTFTLSVTRRSQAQPQPARLR